MSQNTYEGALFPFDRRAASEIEDLSFATHFPNATDKGLKALFKNHGLDLVHLALFKDTVLPSALMHFKPVEAKNKAEAVLRAACELQSYCENQEFLEAVYGPAQDRKSAERHHGQLLAELETLTEFAEWAINRFGRKRAPKSGTQGHVIVCIQEFLQKIGWSYHREWTGDGSEMKSARFTVDAVLVLTGKHIGHEAVAKAFKKNLAALDEASFLSRQE